MPESQFRESFVNDFIAQAANQTFQSIRIEDAVALLSQYDLRPDQGRQACQGVDVAKFGV